MARSSPPMVLLLLATSTLLLAPAFASAANAAQITGMQAACNSSFGIPYPGNDNAVPTNVLSAVDCRACVAEIGTSADDSNMYACYSLCQNPDYFPKTANQDPSHCVACINSTSAYGCQTCMENNLNSSTDRDACFACLKNDPTNGQDPSYMWACSQCQLITNTEAHAQCIACISSKYAQYGPNGTLSATEVIDPSNPPLNDFGKCVYKANYTANLNEGVLDLNGTIYATCSPTGVDPTSLALSPADCVACMLAAENITGPSPVYPVLPRDYACSAYCQDPKYNGNNKDIANACVKCVNASLPADPWACSTCMTTANATSCFDCLTADPYNGTVSNYNWGCSMCAEITSDILRAMCYTCIQSQAFPVDNTTSAGICNCVNLIQNNSFVTDATLDAVQRSCFAPQTFYNTTTGALVIPDIPWGVTTAADGSKNGTDCLTCMDKAGDAKRYACTQYCQDPNLVSTYPEGAECASCVENADDPWGCQNCMATISGNRTQCLTCVGDYLGTQPSHNWACGQCGTISNSSLLTSCFLCVNDDVIDPCLCVDQAKNGTVYQAP